MTGSSADLKQSDDASSWNPGIKDKPRPAGPRPTPGVAQRLPPARPADSRTGQKYLGIGCAIASVMLLIMAGIAGVSWVLFLKNRDDPAQSTASTPQAAAPEDVDQTMIDISLHGGDSTVQWIRLTNDQDERLLTARPDQTGSVPAGTYTVSVKVVARSALSGTIKLNEPTDLTCKPTTMGRIRCVNTQGKTQLLLRP